MEAALGGARADHVEGVAAGADVAAQRGALVVARLALDHAPAAHRLIHLLQAARLAHPYLHAMCGNKQLHLRHPDAKRCTTAEHGQKLCTDMRRSCYLLKT